ncbi:hypothetical protein COY32_01525, partial [candidate division WWE3 bacterium CG_4_10_14_0_2_um_filter_41_14]
NRASASGQIEQNVSGGAMRLQDTSGNTLVQLRTYGDSWLNATTGNVGIGTTGPGAKLEVQVLSTIEEIARFSGIQAANTTGKGIRFYGGVAGANLRGILGYAHTGSGANTILTGETADYMVLRGDNGLQLGSNVLAMTILPTTGNVGIGTTGPGAKLTVAGVTDLMNFKPDQSATGNLLGGSWIENRGGNNLVVFGQADGTAGKGIEIPYFAGTLWKSGIELTNTASGDGNLLLMKNGGNVGIGTTAPGANLDVYKAGVGNVIRLTSDSGYATEININQSNVRAWHIKNTATTGNLAFDDGSGDLVTIQKVSGNVGIGTTGPVYRFEVKTASGATGLTRFLNSDYASGVGTGLAIASGASSGNTYINLQGYNSGGGAYGNVLINGLGGNVGIGTTGPGAKLDIVNSTSNLAGQFTTSYTAGNTNAVTGIAITSNISDNRAFYANASNAGAGKAFSFYGNAGVLYNTGNVGIGTTAPGAKLDVVGSSATAFGALRLTNTSDTTGALSQLSFSSISSSANTVEIDAVKNAAGSAATSLRFRTHSGSAWNTGQLVLDYSGNVGIGTTGPSALLHISKANGAGDVGLIIQNNAVTDGETASLYFRTTTSTTDFGRIRTERVSGTSSKMYLGAFGQTETLTLTSGGNVGIGTVAPLSKLGVLGNASIGATYGAIAGPTSGLIIEGNVGIGTTGPNTKLTVGTAGSNTTNAIASFWGGGTNDTVVKILSTANITGSGPHLQLMENNSALYGFDWWYDSGNNVLKLDRYSNDVKTEVMTINGSGNVGIGTTNPLYSLDVKSAGANIARFNGSGSTGCTLSDGGIIACSSDLNLKKNIADVSYGLDAILALRPVEFNWKTNPDGTSKSLGFIAQDVELVVPKLVSIDPSGNRELNTIGLIPV